MKHAILLVTRCRGWGVMGLMWSVGEQGREGYTADKKSKALTPREMVICEALWLVCSGVPIGRLDSVLCEHHHEILRPSFHFP